MLNIKTRSIYQTVDSWRRDNVKVDKQDLLLYLLHDILSNVGNNYDFVTSNSSSLQGINVSYVLNVYIDGAIFFRKVRSYSGVTMYVKVLNFSRNNLNNETVHEILCAFQKLAPIEAHDHGNNHKINKFLTLINSKK